MKLHIAPGGQTQKGFEGMDSQAGPGINIAWDLEKFPWEPLKNSSVEEIYVSHYVSRAKDLVKFMDELWRICEHGATVKITAPYYSSMRATQDPLSVRSISEATFQYFSKAWRHANNLDHYPMACNFEAVQVLTFINEPWNSKSEEAKQFAQRHYLNVVSDIYVELKAIK